MLAGKLALFTLVPIVGTGVVYPLATKLGGGEKQISLLQMKDFESNCWVSLQGESDDEDGFNKKLLACRVAENSKRVEFYFYNKTSGKDTFPKTVTDIKKTRVGDDYNNPQFTLTLSAGEEIITSVDHNWDSVFKDGLPKKCQIFTQTESDRNVNMKLQCGEKQYPPALEKFVINK